MPNPSPDPIRQFPSRPSRALLVVGVGLAALLMLITLLVTLLLALGGSGEVAPMIGVMAPTTTLLSMILAHRMVRRGLAGGNVVRGTLGYGTLAGMANGALCVLVLSAFMPSGFVLGVVGGAIAAALGAPLGLLFSAIYLLPLTGMLRLQNAWDGGDRFNVEVGLWLMGICGVGATAILVMPCLEHTMKDGARLGLSALAAGAAIGMLIASWSPWRRVHRWRWLRRVRRGRQQGWVVTTEPDVVHQAASLPTVGPAPHQAALAHTIHTAPGAVYREQATLVPVARVTSC